MRKCLFFLSLCLVPFVAFSSTFFTSQNPIDLPTTNSGKSVVDDRGEPLDSQATYRIVPIFWGAGGGDVYLDRSPNSTTLCPNGVFRYNYEITPRGTPVKFIPFGHFGPGIFENQYINIQFTTTKLCVDYSVWKVGDYDVSLGARLLETGGTIGQQFCSGSWFKIVKGPLGYNLLYCPAPLVCPSCPVDQCQTVGEVNQNGRSRLALVKDKPLVVNFSKV